VRQRTKARHVSDRLLSKRKGLGRKVAYWQMERSLSDDELASKAHISVELLKKIKTGEQEPSASMRRKIAEALKVTVGELLE
jgi:transcriptional regulator with XRE-family HTH domain